MPLESSAIARAPIQCIKSRYLIEWFGLGGTMPQDAGAPPPNAVNDIMAWENAQAVCP